MAVSRLGTVHAEKLSAYFSLIYSATLEVLPPATWLIVSSSIIW
jgi:hypothetical protein